MSEQLDEMSVYDGHDLEALSDLRNYQRWIVESFSPYLTGTGVEFGAGIGAMSQWFVPAMDQIDLVEPSPNLVDRLARRFEDMPAVRVKSESMEAYLASQPDESLDTVVLVNLLEHINDDGAALEGLARILRPGGYALIFVPAMPALYSRLDQLLGHHRRYTRRNLAAGVGKAGFEIVSLKYFDFLGILPWWLVNTLGGKESFDPKLSVLYDRVGVPVTRLIESLVSPPIGKNLLLVARRSPSQIE
jgi:SAM-dependent methyltransferase